MIRKVSTHLVAVMVGAAVVYSLTANSQSGEKNSTSSDMSIAVYQIAEELMEPTLITTDAEFTTSMDSTDGKRAVISVKKALPKVSTSVDYVDVTVNGKTIKIDSNGTAIVDDFMVILVDHSKYSKISRSEAK